MATITLPQLNPKSYNVLNLFMALHLISVLDILSDRVIKHPGPMKNSQLLAQEMEFAQNHDQVSNVHIYLELQNFPTMIISICKVHGRCEPTNQGF